MSPSELFKLIGKVPPKKKKFDLQGRCLYKSLAIFVQILLTSIGQKCPPSEIFKLIGNVPPKKRNLIYKVVVQTNFFSWPVFQLEGSRWAQGFKYQQ